MLPKTHPSQILRTHKHDTFNSVLFLSIYIHRLYIEYMSVFIRYVEILKIWYPFLANKDGEAQTIVHHLYFHGLRRRTQTAVFRTIFKKPKVTNVWVEILIQFQYSKTACVPLNCFKVMISIFFWINPVLPFKKNLHETYSASTCCPMVLVPWVQHLRHHPEKLMYITGCARDVVGVMLEGHGLPIKPHLELSQIWNDMTKKDNKLFFSPQKKRSLCSLGQNIMIQEKGVVLMILIFVDSISMVKHDRHSTCDIRHSLGGGIANLLGGQGTDVEML